MIRTKKDDTEFLQFELFLDHPSLIHGVFFRDLKRELLPQLLGINHLISTTQLHGKEVNCIQKSDEKIAPCDGMITNLKKLGLMIFHADCQAAIFYDPIQKAVANVHAGWRGNVLNIYQETLLKMHSQFGTCPENVLVGISPSLGPCHAEFKNYKTEFPQTFWKYQVGSCHFNLWEIAREQLEHAGVLSHHIEVAALCTYDDQKHFFSYRRDKIKGKNNVTIAAVI